MRGWLAIAAVGVALAATPAWTQMRSGGHFGGARPGIGRAPVGQHGVFTARSAPRFSSMRFNRRPFIGHGFRSRFFVGHGARFHHHGRRFFFSGFGWPYAYYGYYPGYYPLYPLFSDTYDVSNNAYAEQNYQLQQQVNQLSNEVQRLREEQTERTPSPPQQSPPQSNTAPTSSTTLVFRDGRTGKVNNYAIAGGTLWVFTEQRARKIPLSELDVPATQKANEEQGLAFQVPPPR